jgi:hypothetical protein
MLLHAGSAPLLAQLGGLRGTVLDEDFGQPVPGVEVLLEQTGATSTTNEQGSFSFNALQPQTYTLQFTKEGYVSKRVTDVLVQPGAVAQTRVELVSDIVELDEVVVIGEDLISEEGTSVDLLITRQDIGQLVDSIGADFISQIGAGSAADALEQVVGTSIQGGKFVVVRGLADRYTNVTLNTGRVPSPDPDKRSVQVDVFPGDLIQSISAYKTFTPDLYADGSGGSVDITTKGVPSDREFSMSAGFSYNTNTSFNDQYLTYGGGGAGVFAKDSGVRELPDVIKATDADTIDGQPRTLAAAEERSKLTNSFSRVIGSRREEAPLNYSVDVLVGDNFEFFGRDTGIALGLTWSRSYQYYPDALIYNWEPAEIFTGAAASPDFLQVQRGEDEVLLGGLISAGHALTDNSDIKLTLFYSRAAEDSATIAVTDPRINLSDRKVVETLEYTARSLGLMQLAGEHRLPTSGAQDLEINWLLGAARTTQDQPDFRSFEATANTVPGGFRLFFDEPTSADERTQRFWRELDETSYNFKIDLALPIFQDSDDESLFKFGAFYEYAEREFRERSFGYNRGNRGDETFFSENLVEDRWSEVFLRSDNLGLQDGGLAYYIYETTTPLSIYNAQQNLGAIYGMFDVQFTPEINLIIGARAAYTDIFTIGAPDLPPALNDIIGNTRASIQRVNVLPALAVSWDVFEDMKLRGAWSRTIARPSFKEISPVRFRDPLTGIIFVGNPNLQLSNISNFDVRWEWFPRDGEVVAVSGFTKFIQQPIELVRFSQTESTFEQFQNLPEGVVYGLEFEFKKRLDWHSELLRHFTFGANYGYFISDVVLNQVDRNARLARGLDPDRRLQGQPDYTFNANLTYNNPDTGLFWGIFYGVVGPQVEVAGAVQVPDVIRRPAPSLDFVLRKKFAEHWEFTFRARNLLNPEEKEVQFFNGREFINELFQDGRSYSFGLSFTW